MDILKGLNRAQLQAVKKKEGIALVISGAGCGGTKVAKSKMSYLIKHCGVPPKSILYLTVTNHAVQSARESAANFLGKKTEVWISTFYAACAKVLREKGEKIGIIPNFVILDEDDQIILVRDCLQELNLMGRETSSNSILSSICRAKDNLIYPEDYKKEAGDDHFKKMVSKTYSLYQEKLETNRSLDFGDLILQTVLLFKKHPEVLSYYQDRFKYIIVDDYQDTNLSCAEFLKILSAKTKGLTVIGNEDHSVFGFRGANIHNILNFEKIWGSSVEKIYLEENYRFPPSILAVANNLLKSNTRRVEKNIYSRKKDGPPPVFYKASNEYEEAWFVTREIMERIKKEKRKYCDFAVLYRTPGQSRIFEETFTQSNIPYKITSGFKFFQRKEIKDIISYLRVLSNFYDNLSFKRIVNAPLRGIGSITLLKLEQMATKNKMALSEIVKDDKSLGLLRPSIKDTLFDFNDFLKELNKIRKNKSISEICKIILKKTKYLEELEKDDTDESKNKLSAIEDFIVQIKKLEKEQESLAHLLEKISLHNEIDDYDRKHQSVTLMTVHNTKGLEFPVVFLVGLEEGIFPHWGSLKDDIDLEEERRLCYVGTTRAQDVLYITCAHSRNSYGGVKYNKTSRFIEELGLLDKNIGYKGGGKGKEAKAGDSLPKKQESFKMGDKVYHDRWGEGKIVEIRKENNVISVSFVSVGLKNLILDYAPLKKL